jgi:hypothetical protein
MLAFQNKLRFGSILEATFPLVPKVRIMIVVATSIG